MFIFMGYWWAIYKKNSYMFLILKFPTFWKYLEFLFFVNLWYVYFLWIDCAESF